MDKAEEDTIIKLYLTDGNEIYRYNMCIVNDELAFTSIPKNGCSVLSYLHLKNLGIKTTYEEYNHWWNWDILWKHQVKIDDDVCKDKHVVCVLRDPIERFISSKNTVDRNITFDQYCNNVKYTFDTLDINNIDLHLLPQTMFFNKNDIDEYIFLKDLGAYLLKYNIYCPSINCNPDKSSYNVPETIAELYREDFKFISNL